MKTHLNKSLFMFEPWIGNHYNAQTIPKILILGESHYGDNHIKLGYELAKKTIYCIEDQIMHNTPYPFYTKLASTFIGHRPNLNEKTTFWHSVAYHNLITTPLVASRRAPTFEQWKESFLTLPTIINSLKPDYVVVLGYRMWKHLTVEPSLRNVPDIRNAGPCGLRALGTSYFHGIMHPSGPFSPSQWHSVIQSVKGQLWPGLL
jgi:hypothetical protein